ncbi:acyltransferase family protein [Bacillus pumilus]|uniref:acyltransferase family protein n=1 Tax=Bacillus pumilus TaxID=1408 RepID=UPI00192E37E5|nr:acyltransferase family protein [Bacillus pumilus]
MGYKSQSGDDLWPTVVVLKFFFLAEGVGFALIIWAIATFDPAMQWPGYLALVPVVGAMLVLAANRQRSWLTANPLARQLGASSYSIYLWHWPLVVLLTYAGEQANPQWMVAGGEVTFMEPAAEGGTDDWGEVVTR